MEYQHSSCLKTENMIKHDISHGWENMQNACILVETSAAVIKHL